MKARSGLAALLVLVALAGLTLPGAASSHSHETGTVGLYNADCPLALLATLTPSALPVHALSAASLALLSIALAPFVVTARLGSAPSLADVRAPPVR